MQEGRKDGDPFCIPLVVEVGTAALHYTHIPLVCRSQLMNSLSNE